MAELSAYVAAIRPGFASLLNNFVERKPYTTGVKELDDILEDSFHYLIYQESIMKYLVWLGVEEKGTYDIIKKIAKKKFKEDELEALKNNLVQGWIRNVGSEDGFAETWQVVNDAAHYSFNASHSLSVAIDSLYGAYLKAHYPLEYYTVVLTMYSGDMDRTANLIEEMPEFGLILKDARFRHSKAEYNCDKEERVIYKGCHSIKYLNENVANKLYEMKDQKFDSFIDLLKIFPGDSRQLNILIKLDYFQEFGPSGTLLRIAELYDRFAGKKIIKKDKTFGIPVELLEKYSTQTEKQYRITDQDALITELCAMVPNIELPIHTRIEAQQEYLGYVSIVLPDKKQTGYVMDINTKYSPKITIYHLYDGKTVTYKCQKRAYQNNPFDIGSIIKFNFEMRNKSRKDENGQWVKLPETEPWITNYLINVDI